MEVVCHELGASSGRQDGGGVDLEELIWVDGTVVLLGQVRLELGGPVDPPQVRRECLAAGPIWAGVVVGGGVVVRGHA